MATLVRCIEGHAFDMAASETCPICGSTVGKDKSVLENKPSPDRTKAKQIAMAVGYVFASIVFVLATIGIAYDIWTSNFVKSVIQNVSEHIHHPPPPRSDEEIRKSILKKLGAGSKPDDTNTVSQPATPREIPNPFVSPEPRNPFDSKTQFDSK
jgi:hypothetical protein